MSASKFAIGGIFIIAAIVSVVPLFKRDYANYSESSYQSSETFMDKTKALVSQNLFANNRTPSNDEIGSYNGTIVKRSELTSQEKQSLFDAESQMYKAIESLLARRYFDSLIDKYATEKKITDKNLAQQQYIQDNVKVSDADAKAFIQQNIDNPQLKGKSTDEQMDLVKPYLMQQAVGAYFRGVVAKAKSDGVVKVTGVKMPESPRINIDIANAPSQGPKDAPITIVEFADFQCPFCYSTKATVKSILDKYKNKIHFVFRNYPLIQLHPQAVNAAIAAECAGKQSKYWEMHDVLFDNHSKLADDLYDTFAKKLGLDLNKFQTCFKDSNVKGKVMDDVAYGQSLGINATPAFYINGILLMGAQPESEFVSIIDKELTKK